MLEFPIALGKYDVLTITYGGFHAVYTAPHPITFHDRAALINSLKTDAGWSQNDLFEIITILVGEEGMRSCVLSRVRRWFHHK
jgi:hypothetical protein